jgi:hypothetical protein
MCLKYLPQINFKDRNGIESPYFNQCFQWFINDRLSRGENKGFKNIVIDRTFCSGFSY